MLAEGLIVRGTLRNPLGDRARHLAAECEIFAKSRARLVVVAGVRQGGGQHRPRQRPLRRAGHSVAQSNDSALVLAQQGQSEALNELERDDVIQAALGPIAAEFLRLKRAEWEEYHRQVTDWELARYLTMF